MSESSKFEAVYLWSSRLQRELQSASDDEVFKIWRRQGAIGKLHNIVTYVARSDQRIRAFEAVQKKVYTKDATLHLIKDTGVRWNSTYYMINRAIKLQAAIKRYCRDWRPAPHERYDLKGDFLDNEAWEELEH